MNDFARSDPRARARRFKASLLFVVAPIVLATIGDIHARATSAVASESASALRKPGDTQIVLVDVVPGPSLPRLSISMDDTTFFGPHTFGLPAGSTHLIGTDSIQTDGPDTVYKWDSWSDGGTRIHEVTPVGDTTYTAYYLKQFRVTVVSGAGGSVNPVPPFADVHSAVNLIAKPDPGFVFGGWEGSGNGSYSGPDNPTFVQVNEPIVQRARFDPFGFDTVRVTIETEIVALNLVSQQPIVVVNNSAPVIGSHTFAVPRGWTLSVGTDSLQPGGQFTRFRWDHWSDGGARMHAVTPVSDTTFTATFMPQHRLLVLADSGGTVAMQPPFLDSFFDIFADVQLTAIPDSVHRFSVWDGSGNGSYSGPDNPTFVRVNEPLVQRARFDPLGFDTMRVTIDTEIIALNLVSQQPIVVANSTPFTGSHTFAVPRGSTLAIGTDSIHSEGQDTRLRWDHWSDGGARAHTVTPISDTTFTATFMAQHHLLVLADSGGTVAMQPPFLDSFFDVFADVQLTAIPDSVHRFSVWEGAGNGSYSGPDNPAWVRINEPIVMRGRFDRLPLETVPMVIPIEIIGLQLVSQPPVVVVDDTSITNTRTFDVLPGSAHTIGTDSIHAGEQGVRYVWDHWSDGGARIHQVTPISDTAYTAIFRTQYLLTMEVDSGGTIVVNDTPYPVDSFFDVFAEVTIEAKPDSGWQFDGWEGDTTSARARLVVLMNRWKKYIPKFIRDILTPLPQAGLGNGAFFSLAQNSPNPFNPSTSIRFSLPQPGEARVAVYDPSGRLVRVLVDQSLPAGTHEVVWDGRDATGNDAASGVYLYRLTSTNGIETRRMALVR